MVDKIRAFVARWYLLHTKMRFCIFFAEFWLLEALQERSERWSTTSVTSISSPPSPPLPTPPPLAMSPWTGYRKAYEKVQQIKNSPEFGPSDMWLPGQQGQHQHLGLCCATQPNLPHAFCMSHVYLFIIQSRNIWDLVRIILFLIFMAGKKTSHRNRTLTFFC